jgi:DNA-binding GntR family transcriptional regulator
VSVIRSEIEAAVRAFTQRIAAGDWDHGIPIYAKLHTEYGYSSEVLTAAFGILERRQLVYRSGVTHAVMQTRSGFWPLDARAEVYAAILSEIANGRLRVGGLLPSQARLCETFGVHRSTVHAVIRRLRSERVLFPHARLPKVAVRVSEASAATARRGGLWALQPPNSSAANTRLAAETTTASLSKYAVPRARACTWVLGQILTGRYLMGARITTREIQAGVADVSRVTAARACLLLCANGVLARAPERRIVVAPWLNMDHARELHRQYAAVAGQRRLRRRQPGTRRRLDELVIGRMAPGTVLHAGDEVFAGLPPAAVVRWLQAAQNGGLVAGGPRTGPKVVMPAWYLADRVWIRCFAGGLVVHFAGIEPPGSSLMLGLDERHGVTGRAIAGRTLSGPTVLMGDEHHLISGLVGASFVEVRRLAADASRLLEATPATQARLREQGRLLDETPVPSWSPVSSVRRPLDVYVIGPRGGEGPVSAREELLVYWYVSSAWPGPRDGGFVSVVAGDQVRVSVVDSSGRAVAGTPSWTLERPDWSEPIATRSVTTITAAVNAVATELREWAAANQEGAT